MNTLSLNNGPNSCSTGNKEVCILYRRTVLALVLAASLFPPLRARGGDITTGIAPVNGTELYYEMTGDGHPLVLMHSGGLDSRMWEDQFQVFAQYYKVVRYDVRGFGKSPKSPTKPYSDEEDLYHLLKFLNVEKAHLVGLSLGGRIAIDFTLVHPEMVEVLIPVAPGLSGYPFSAESVQILLKIIYAIQEEDGSPAGELWLQSPYLAPAMENLAVAQRLRPIAIENSHIWLINPLFPRPPFPPARQRLSEIRAPTLIIVGDRDLPDIQTIVQTLEEGITGAKKVVIPGAGHIVNMEKPKEFNRIVLDFLRR